MSYYGYQGIHSRRPVYRHDDGSVSAVRPTRIMAWHEECAHAAFGVDTSREGYGSWHHDLGISWSPGRYSLDSHPCEVCGGDC